MAGAGSHFQLDPDRRVIAGLFPAARGPVDAGGRQLRRQRRAQQRMVDADAGVALERVPPVRPKSVDALVRVERADGVGPALPDQLREPRARLRREQRVLQLTLGLVDVLLSRNDVVIADQDCRDLAVEQIPRMRL